MSSIRRILANQANGRRSSGPITLDGKARSAMSALSHGLLARIVLMQDESPEAFQDLVNQRVTRFLPADGVEIGFIEEMAASAWRLRRAWAMGTRMLDNMAAAETEGDRLDRTSTVHADPAAQHSLDLLLRYETRLHLMYQRAFQNLLLLRTLDMRNEPNPISEHSPPALTLPALPPPAQDP